jgi:hypothetical protein
MGAEDFSFMREACPGNRIFMGNGDSAGLHHPACHFQWCRHPLRSFLLDVVDRDGDANLIDPSLPD